MVADRRLDAAVLKVGMVCLIVWVAFVGHSPIVLTVRLRAAGQSVDAPAHNDQTSDDWDLARGAAEQNEPNKGRGGR
jgi:hypothetical protein